MKGLLASVSVELLLETDEKFATEKNPRTEREITLKVKRHHAAIVWNQKYPNGIKISFSLYKLFSKFCVILKFMNDCAQSTNLFKTSFIVLMQSL